MTITLVALVPLQQKGRIGLPAALRYTGVVPRDPWMQALEPGHVRICAGRPKGHGWPVEIDGRSRLVFRPGFLLCLQAEPHDPILICRDERTLHLYGGWRIEELLATTPTGVAG